MSFRTFDLAHDVASIVSSINEVVSLSSASWTGSGESNVKFYQNISTGSSITQLGGYWQSMYDMSPAAVSATAMFDVTFGYTTGSAFNTNASVSSSQNEKIKVYRQITNALQGDPDKPFVVNSLEKKECFFLMVKRGLMKDELKKGSVTVTLAGSGGTVTLSDAGAATNYKQTVGGDYAPLFSGSTEVGQVWYNSGLIVIPVQGTGLPWGVAEAAWFGANNLTQVMQSHTIDMAVSGLRNGRLRTVGFHNQTNLYSTVYFCRATNTEFNYSSNPTFIDANKRIRVTSGSNIFQTRTYITTVGMYDANDNLLAVGKLNKPVTKSPDTEAVFRIRLDY
jgi:hypothetical protein